MSIGVAPIFALLTLLLLVFAHLQVAEALVDGVSSYECHLPGNPWLAADEIARLTDGCSWEANGFAVRR